MNRQDWPVIISDSIGDRGQCVYCRVPIGEQHAVGCVKRKRTVVVEVTFQYVTDYPEDFEPSSIEFQLDGSSSCKNNIVNDLHKFTERQDWCWCAFGSAKFIREATAQDEEDWLVKVEDLKS